MAMVGSWGFEGQKICLRENTKLAKIQLLEAYLLSKG